MILSILSKINSKVGYASGHGVSSGLVRSSQDRDEAMCIPPSSTLSKNQWETSHWLCPLVQSMLRTSV